MTFKSAVDWWYYAIIVGVAAMLGYFAITDAMTGAGLDVVLLAVSVLLGVGFPVWLLFSTRYTITDDKLVVRAGPFSWHIRRSDIRSIKATRSPLSAPALSLNRLKICYGQNRMILVSPDDADAFTSVLLPDA